MLDGVGERGDQLVDAHVQGGDVSGEGVDAAQHAGAEEGVVVVEVSGQRLAQLRELDPHPAVGEVGEHARVTLPGDHRVQHLAAGHAVQVTDHRIELDLRVFQDLLQA